MANSEIPAQYSNKVIALSVSDSLLLHSLAKLTIRSNSVFLIPLLKLYLGTGTLNSSSLSFYLLVKVDPLPKATLNSGSVATIPTSYLLCGDVEPVSPSSLI
jgi:hypothetical protein